MVYNQPNHRQDREATNGGSGSSDGSSHLYQDEASTTNDGDQQNLSINIKEAKQGRQRHQTIQRHHQRDSGGNHSESNKEAKSLRKDNYDDIDAQIAGIKHSQCKKEKTTASVRTQEPQRTRCPSIPVTPEEISKKDTIGRNQPQKSQPLTRIEQREKIRPRDSQAEGNNESQHQSNTAFSSHLQGTSCDSHSCKMDPGAMGEKTDTEQHVDDGSETAGKKRANENQTLLI